MSDSMKPCRIRLRSHNEHRVVRKGKALRRSCTRTTSFFQLPRTIFLQAESHVPLRPKTYVDDLRTTDHIDGLVRVLRDVIGATAIVLDENMVYRVIEYVLDVLSNQSYGRRERE